MNTMRHPLYPLIAIAFYAALAGCTQSGAHNEPAAPVRAVRTAAVERTAVSKPVRAVGVLEPQDRLTLAFKVGGVVANIAVHDGDTVRRGQLLAELERTEIDASVRRAEQAAAKAQRDRDRTQALYKDDVATLEQLEDATTAFEVARADLETARFNARYSRIEAPADGFVVRRQADASELVSAGQPVVTIGSLAKGWQVRAAVTDRDVVKLRAGDAARVTFDAYPGASFAGRVLRLPAASDPASGTYDVEVAVDPAGASFVQGLVAKVELTLASARRTEITVPIEALLEADGAHGTVYVLGPAGSAAAAHAEKRRITLGDIVGNRAEVRAGLEAGEQIVIEGGAWIANGEPVIVVAERD